MVSDDSILEIGPYNPSRRTVFVKSGLGLLTGMFISFLVFIFLILVGGLVQDALSSMFTGVSSGNPLLPLILIVIAFVGTFVGSILIAGVFNLIYTDKYYDMGKMFSLVLFANVILFFMFVGLYVLFAQSINQLFFVLATHVLFTVFISYALIETSTNPNYAGVHIIGAAIGLTVAILFFSIGFKLININQGNSVNILLSLPPVLAYTMLPFWHGIREKVYYRLYEMGHNFFYIPSLSEVLVDEEEVDDVEVDMGT